MEIAVFLSRAFAATDAVVGLHFHQQQNAIAEREPMAESCESGSPIRGRNLPPPSALVALATPPSCRATPAAEQKRPSQ
jgi:hypothetical protein